jgi:hypothetical protein
MDPGDPGLLPFPPLDPERFLWRDAEFALLRSMALTPLFALLTNSKLLLTRGSLSLLALELEELLSMRSSCLEQTFPCCELGLLCVAATNAAAAAAEVPACPAAATAASND